MGKGTGTANEPVRKRNANETKTGRPKHPHLKAPARTRRLGEKHDFAAGQEERVPDEENVGTRKVCTTLNRLMFRNMYASDIERIFAAAAFEY